MVSCPNPCCWNQREQHWSLSWMKESIVGKPRYFGVKGACRVLCLVVPRRLPVALSRIGLRPVAPTASEGISQRGLLRASASEDCERGCPFAAVAHNPCTIGISVQCSCTGREFLFVRHFRGLTLPGQPCGNSVTSTCH